MKAIIVLVIAFACGYFVYQFLSGSKHLPGPNSSIITEIKEHPGSYTDRDLDVEGKIIESETLMNYTKSTISDINNNEIILVGKKPYKAGEDINVNAHLYVIYQGQGKQYLILIDDDFKMLNNILPLLERGLF